MIAVDGNILVYAHRLDSPFHAAAARCLIDLAAQPASWAIPWPCIHEFCSIATNPKIYRPASDQVVATAFVDGLLEAPTLVLLGETERHWQTLRRLIVEGRLEGGAVHDARIAAICLDHGVHELWSADRDFGRFPDLKVVNPLIR